METQTPDNETLDRCSRCDRPLGMVTRRAKDGANVHVECLSLPVIEPEPDIIESTHEIIDGPKVCVVEGCGQTISTPNDKCYIHYECPGKEIETG